MTATTRAWTQMTLGSAVQWMAEGALVRVMSPRPGLWAVDLYEDGAWIGSEELAGRAEAVQVARRWVRALSRPTHD